MTQGRRARAAGCGLRAAGPGRDGPETGRGAAPWTGREPRGGPPGEQADVPPSTQARFGGESVGPGDAASATGPWAEAPPPAGRDPRSGATKRRSGSGGGSPAPTARPAPPPHPALHAGLPRGSGPRWASQAGVGGAARTHPSLGVGDSLAGLWAGCPFSGATVPHGHAGDRWTRAQSAGSLGHGVAHVQALPGDEAAAQQTARSRARLNAWPASRDTGEVP